MEVQDTVQTLNRSFIKDFNLNDCTFKIVASCRINLVLFQNSRKTVP